jgi:uncharacterized protein
MAKKATFRFYEELNDFLPPQKRKVPFSVEFRGNPSIKDIMESLGVPHTEADLILSNGESVPFSYHVKDGDTISVYPEFESLNIASVTRLNKKPLREIKFIADVNLGKLAKYLRLLGFDCLYNKEYTASEIIETAETQKCIILTRAASLLKNKKISRGYWIRSQYPQEQTREVIRRFDISADMKPFSRCLICNGIITEIEKENVINELEPETIKNYYEFSRCSSCKKIYWKGSHTIKLQTFIQSIAKKDTKEKMNNQ